ncbi:hypothetical protein I6N90_20815 [Paenibacillus sp. GSMTC-2017]|nr:hypothetical protein [Paenibacillus sp. GSMTC-2017]MBH5320242.1 hypothetical protein [Paenibacillus sp. GSMTC-2017]
MSKCVPVLSVKTGENIAIFWIDSDWMTLNGTKRKVDDNVFITKGRT